MYGQNKFSRAMANDSKMGAYYTDTSHCLSIGEMFFFDRLEETSVLEPSIGDGTAVKAVTGADGNPNIRIFGCELNDEVARKLKEDNLYEEIIEADYLEGTRIKQSAFSFCFANPPYITDAEDGERYEYKFLQRITDQLKQDAYLVWVVPYSQFTEWKHFRFIACNYEICTVYRFRECEYEKFHQIVAVLRRKPKHILLKQEVEERIKPFLVEEDIHRLPVHPLERYDVPSSEASKVVPFCSKEFDSCKAFKLLDEKMGGIDFCDLSKIVDKRITTKAYTHGRAGRPPIPPKKDTLYLMATSGYGAGLTGSSSTNDLHLQRGVAEVVEETVVEEDPQTHAEILRVTSRTKITMTVVESDGRITILE